MPIYFWRGHIVSPIYITMKWGTDDVTILLSIFIREILTTQTNLFKLIKTV